MRFRLSVADRARLDAPEFLPIELDTVTVREAIELQALGFPTPAALSRALRAGEEGPNYRAWVVVVWLALRRAGVNCEAATLDFDINHLDLLPDEEPEPVEVPGKAPARGRSTNSPTKSSTRGATSEVKSTPTGSSS